MIPVSEYLDPVSLYRSGLITSLSLSFLHVSLARWFLSVVWSELSFGHGWNNQRKSLHKFYGSDSLQLFLTQKWLPYYIHRTFMVREIIESDIFSVCLCICPYQSPRNIFLTWSIYYLSIRQTNTLIPHQNNQWSFESMLWSIIITYWKYKICNLNILKWKININLPQCCMILLHIHHHYILWN